MHKFTAHHGDLKLSLRKTGNSEPSIVIESDEGDCIQTFIKDHKISKVCYAEWINQLELVINELKELKDAS